MSERLSQRAASTLPAELRCSDESIGRVKAFFGNFGMMVRALSYIYTHGAEGLREATEAAVLNARYLSQKLEGTLRQTIRVRLHARGRSSRKRTRRRPACITLDIAKRLIDYGFHPMTVYFPLVVEGAMLIEPTESVGRADLDAFVEAMLDIDAEVTRKPRARHRRAAFDTHRPPRRSRRGSQAGSAMEAGYGNSYENSIKLAKWARRLKK